MVLYSYLVNGTRNQTLNVLFITKYVWEGGTESWRSLHCWEANLSNVAGVIKSKDRLCLVGCHMFANPKNLPVKVWLGARYIEKINVYFALLVGTSL